LCARFPGASRTPGADADHTGQLGSLPNATLLIGDREWAALTAPKPMAGANVAGFTHWISGGGKLPAFPAAAR
jgi:hypothetical protein